MSAAETKTTKHIWIGMNGSESFLSSVVENGGRLLSAYVSQTNLIQALEEAGSFSMDSLNALRLPEYPRYRKWKVEGETWSRTGDSVDCSVGYWNLPYFSHLSKANAMKKTACQWAKQHKDQAVVVWVYSMHTPFLKAAKAIKQIIPSAQVILIVPDLPQFMDLNISSIKKLLKKLDWKRICNLLPFVDRYILYSAHMASFLGLKEEQWMRMEGSVDLKSVLSTPPVHDSSVISVMYSGACHERFGIPALLDAFSLLRDRDYELWISGGGNAEELIRSYEQRDPRIHFLGFLPSRNELLLKQKQATMLINMRDPDEEASAFCFPSKLFEYMASGNPVLSFQNRGIPEEYGEYLFWIDRMTPEAIAKTIQEVGALSEQERQACGERTQKFVLEQKNSLVQADKMLRFVQKGLLG